MLNIYLNIYDSFQIELDTRFSLVYIYVGVKNDDIPKTYMIYKEAGMKTRCAGWANPCKGGARS